MSRTNVSIVILLTATIACSMPAVAAAQRATAGGAQVVELARRGNAAEAWAAWNALPTGPAKLRVGVEAAIALKDLPRGVELYGQLATTTKAPDRTLLRSLALAAAGELAAGPDQDAAASACSAALRLVPTQQPCRGMLERMASRGTTTGEQAIGAYALADAGLRPFPTLFTGLELNLTSNAKLSFAQRFAHLPNGERAGLVIPVLEGTDVPSRYQALLILGTIPGREAEAAIQSTEATSGLLRGARLVAMAQHGDTASLDALSGSIDTLDDTLKIFAALALALNGDARGSAVIDGLMRSPVDLQRIYAADAATRINPRAGQQTILETLKTGSPAIRILALGAAGRARLGTDALVYTRLVGGEPELRAQAVTAIADTLLAPPLPPEPVSTRPPLPTP